MKIPVVVDFNRESPHRAGWVELSERGDDTIVIKQSLDRTEQWESDAISTVFVPRIILLEFLAD